MGPGMTARFPDVVAALTLAWLRLYTRGLAGEVAESRIAEIESDFWEMRHDAGTAPSWRRRVMEFRRLVDGIPDDLAWRIDAAPLHQQLITRRVIALAAATLIVLSLWSVPPLLMKGRPELASCADSAAAPTSTAALRHDVIRCAGAFFARRD
jgi:hypothetical protein